MESYRTSIDPPLATARSSSDAGRPLCASVVIATCNRRERLGQVLWALAEQSVVRGTFDVVVVDDGSADGTTDWVRSQTLPFGLCLVAQANRGPSAARNAGIGAAQGPVVIFLDDDLVPDRDLVREHLRSHGAERDVAVIGPAQSLATYRQPWIVWQQGTYERAYRRMTSGDLQPTFRQFWSGNCSVAREHLVKAGGFDESLRYGEDVELGYRLMTRGVRFRFNPAARGLHYSSRSFGGWRKTHAMYGHLDVEILRRLGEDTMYRRLGSDWRRRRGATRWIVRRSAGQPACMGVLVAALRGCVLLGTVAPGSVFSRAACAALANVLYWDGIARTLSADRSLFARLDQAGESATR